ncbi:class I SAM-dependent methyltransferase [Roseospira marina]|uniref:Class I SAM-dependent methyltransferase n=1 Tax=Roseospira marina TaxID=140057 RepID=A0A5M6I7I2_9PROT|nr:class I SAM-dependent methyltransferase [Roseospira marina]KAA5604224.1 class I SAM-dependent methyltransferase [Roseospira marina]MBB4315631.1 O-methyltransferase involved in polyketide biosynthesis [Roseospira marina]MBB5088627.1 O-methyltransferase involved in polyketide biosynthesis [Roseospira marina]
MTTIAVSLTDVPETMLWTLHNRASEAARPDGVLRDEVALRIYRSLNYDFVRSFGPADASHGVRSAVFDSELTAFLAAHPDGVIVNLGEGLETQRFRVAGDKALWITVDVPEAIAVRERFITPDAQHRHVPLSIMDRGWFDAVPTDRPVYITAQGLLMYFEPDDVAVLLGDMAKRFPGAWFAFDHIPRWFSEKTLRGLMKTPHYRAPRMPWGINIDEIRPALEAWVPDLAEYRRLPFRWPRGFFKYFYGAWTVAPIFWRYAPGIARIRFGARDA